MSEIRRGAPVPGPRGRPDGGREPEDSIPFASDRLWLPKSQAPPCHAMTCDVEDYFQVSAFETVVPKHAWDSMQTRLPRNMDRVLQLLSDASVSGTFFTLGWIAQRFPEIVRRISDEGHEVASHGMRHIRVWTQQPKEFLEDVSEAKRLLEDVSGRRVTGYRAASWSIDGRTPWAHQVLGEAGYEYSSSLYPISHDHYGAPSAPTHPFYVRSADILEIPASTVKLLGRNWPASGGGYFRLLPLEASLWLLKRVSGGDVPAVFYFHPWELDPNQPRIDGIDWRSRFRHYLNLHKFEARLKVVLKSFSWGRMDEIFVPRSLGA